MAVGAQNDLGGQQTFARKMIWCIAFLCQNWDGFFCPNWGVLQKKKVFPEIWTVFLSKFRCSPKKKKGLPWNLNGFSVQMFSKIKKKKKKRSAPKLRRYFGNGVPKYPDYLPKWIDHLPEFLMIFDVLNRMGGRPPPLPPRLLRLWLRYSKNIKWYPPKKVLGNSEFCSSRHNHSSLNY